MEGLLSTEPTPSSLYICDLLMVRMKVMSVSSLSCSLSIWKQEASSSNCIMGLHHLLRRFGLVHLRVVDLNILGGWNVKDVPLLQNDIQEKFGVVQYCTQM